MVNMNDIFSYAAVHLFKIEITYKTPESIMIYGIRFSLLYYVRILLIERFLQYLRNIYFLGLYQLTMLITVYHHYQT